MASFPVTKEMKTWSSESNGLINVFVVSIAISLIASYLISAIVKEKEC